MAAVVSDSTVNNSVPPPVISHDRVFSQIQDILPRCISSNDIEPFLQVFEGKVRYDILQ